MKIRSILSKSFLCGALAVLVLPAMVQPAAAAIYMKFEGGNELIKGNVTVPGFEDYIEVNSFQWGVGRAISSSPKGGARDIEASAPNFSEIVVTRASDEIVPLFMSASTVGRGYDKITIAFYNFGGEQPPDPKTPYLKYELKNVLISGYSLSSGGDRPSESLSLNYTAIQITSIPFDDAGKPGTPIVRKWDIATGRATFATSREEPFEPQSPPAITGTTIGVKP